MNENDQALDDKSHEQPSLESELKKRMKVTGKFQ